MSFICIADLHLSHTVPICRKETITEWYDHQKKVLDFISKKCRDTKSSLLIAGDVFDKPCVEEKIVNLFLDFLNDAVLKDGRDAIIMAGNHDLEFRSLNTYQTSFGVLERAFKYSPHVQVNDPTWTVDYTDKPVEEWKISSIREAVLVHTLCYQTEAECEFGGCTASALLDKFPKCEIVVVGDQHHGFCYEKDDRFLVNCGCITKRNTSFKDEILKIWYYDDNEHTVQAIELPIDNGVYDNHRIEIVTREGNSQVLLNKLTNGKGITADFRKNVLDGLTTAALMPYSEDVVRKYMEV